MTPIARDRLAVARALREIGAMLRLLGANPFRARAYERGASALEALHGDLDEVVREGRLTETPGIGPALAAEIEALFRTGTSSRLERLRAELPPGAVELARVPGMSLRRIAALSERLGVRSVPELRAACESGRAREAKGFGPATEKRILEALRARDAEPRPLLLHEATREAEPLLAHLRGAPGVERAEIGGPLRRGAETVPAIEIVVAAPALQPAVDALTAWPRVGRPLETAEDRVAGELASGARVDVQVVAPPAFAAAWHRSTGSPAHVARVLALPARDREPPRDEEAIYAARGLPFVPPELREDDGEVEAALAGDALEHALVRSSDLRGVVHCHTSFSDGRASLEEMARAADRLGAEYMTVTDHSPSAFYARGLAVERLREQWDEIDRVQEKVRVRLLRGTESDILEDGALDYPDVVLEELDVVIASVHSRHRHDAGRATRRIVRALRHPLFKVWGHPLGRLVGRRPPIACDVAAVLEAAAESRVAIEINGDPHRLDMEPRLLREARRRGVSSFVVSTDAHSPAELMNARWGVLTARRGGVRTHEVLNARPLAAFAAAVRPRG